MKQIARGLFCLGVAMMIAAATGCTKLPPPTPLSQLNDQQVRGYYAFRQHCAGCHSDRSNRSLNGPSLRSIFKKQYLNSGAPANDDRVMSVVMFGYGTMPAQGSALTPQEREDLLAYLHTL